MKWVLMAALWLFSVQALADISARVPSDPALMPVYKALTNGREKWRDVDRGLAEFSAPRPYGMILFVQCGARQAFFDSGSKQITVCLELVRDIANKAGGDDAAITAALVHVIMHEYGHALIAAAEVPPVGREEDAADQISAVLARKIGMQGVIMSALLRSSMRDRSIIYVYGARGAADEHSLGPQRRANVLCWMVGDSPEWMEAAIKAGDMTPARAARCPAEIIQAERAVAALLKR